MITRNQLIGLALAAVAIALLLGTGITMLHKASARLESAHALHDYLDSERQSLGTLRDKSQFFGAKRRNSRGMSVHQAMDQVISSLTLKEKLTSLKSPSGGTSALEDRAEARFEGLTLNELVNLLFTMDNSRMLLITRKANIRTSFENPELLNAILSVTLIRPE